MDTSQPHRNAVLKLVRTELDAPAFIFGYLLVDIPDERLCNAIAAFGRHKADLAALESGEELAVDDE